MQQMEGRATRRDILWRYVGPLVRKISSRFSDGSPGLRWFFAAALIPGLIIGVGLSYAIYRNERNALEEGSVHAARALLRAVDSELLECQATALALAKSVHLQHRDLAAFHARAVEVLKLSGKGHNLVLSDSSGQQILNTAKPIGEPLPRHGNLAQLNRVVQTGRPAISDLYVGAVLRRPLIGIDVPVIEGGATVYVLSIGLLPEQFNQLLADHRLPQGWIGAILDSQDIVVARNLTPEKFIGVRATADLRQAMAQSDHGTLASRSLEGTPTLVSFAKSGVTGWTAAVGMARALLYQGLYRLLALVVVALLVFLASGAALAWIVSSYVRRALKALGAATDAAAASGGAICAPTNSGVHEIDQLAIKFNAMHAAQKAMEMRISDMALHDPLTGLANRRLFVDRLGQCLAQNRRSSHYAALMFLDLDNFKVLNDSHGHAAGDLLLVEVAARLTQCVREVDTVARLGGDEFVVLAVDLEGTEAAVAAGALLVAERIRTKLAEPYSLHLTTDPHQAKAVEHRCTASVGLTLFATFGAKADDILDLADAAMYQAKNSGRNRVVLAAGPAESPGRIQQV